MIRADRNAEINEILRNEYYSFTVPFLTEWSAAFDKEVPPFRINEFGIIDEKRYDTDKGVLFVGKETNNWDNEDYEKGYFFVVGWRALLSMGLPVEIISASIRICGTT